MAESSNSGAGQSFSLFPLESTQLQVSDEAFNLFHSIDRELCTRLIHNLGRDPAQAVQIMAFWMWLERESKDMNFIKHLLSLPFTLLHDVVDETLICLRCVDGCLYASSEVLTLLPEILSSRFNSVVSLRLFHENRDAVARAVSKIINTVCARAFSDILRGAAIGQPATYPGVAPDAGDAPQAVLFRPHLALPPPMEVVGVPVHMSYPAYDFAAQRHMIGSDLGDMLTRNLNLNLNLNLSINNNNRSDENGGGGGGGGEEVDVAADDRTIFLTFSKGYPISEEEVTDFFTRRFGDFIEDLIMQEVGEDEQVLYARMVAYHESVIDGIVGGNKAKYVINGKHVWARKYVKKQHQSRWSSSPSGGDEPAPSCSPSSTTTVLPEQS